MLGYYIDWACHIEGGCYFWCGCFISRGGYYIDRSGFIYGKRGWHISRGVLGKDEDNFQILGDK